MILNYPPPFQDLRTLSEHICSSKSTIENWVRLGLFPPPKKVGGKNLWRWKDVEKHLANENNLSQSSEDDERQRIINATRKATTKSSNY
jgi:predicted DNA-binding transcriptional regulator AlpA